MNFLPDKDTSRKNELLVCIFFITLIVLFHFITNIHFFVSFKRLFDKDMFYTFDFPKHFYDSQFSRASYFKNLDILKYNLRFLNGFSLNSILKRGCLNIFIPILLPEISIVFIQKFLYSISILIVPVILFFSFVNWGLSKKHSLIATFIGISFFRLDIPLFFSITGKYNVYLSLSLTFLIISMIFKFFLDNDPKKIFLISLCCSLSICIFPYSILPISFILLFAFFHPKSHKYRHLKLISLILVASLILNGFFIIPLIKSNKYFLNSQSNKISHEKMKSVILINSSYKENKSPQIKFSTQQILIKKTKSNNLKTLRNYFSTEQNYFSQIALKGFIGTKFFRIIIILLGILGIILVIIKKNYTLIHFLIYCFISILLVDSTMYFFKIHFEVFQCFLLSLLNLLLILLSSYTLYLLYEFLSETIKGSSSYLLVFFLVAFLVLNFSIPFYYKPLNPQRIVGKLLPGKLLTIFDILKKETNKDSRILFEKSSRPYEGSENIFSSLFDLPILFAINNDRMIFEDLQAETSNGIFRDGIFSYKNINNFDFKEINRYLTLYNVKWIFIHSPESKWFFDKYKDEFKSKELFNSWLYTKKFNEGYFSRGKGKIFIDFPEIIVFDITPSNGTLELKF